MQVHNPLLHRAFEPHGEGSHGSFLLISIMMITCQVNLYFVREVKKITFLRKSVVFTGNCRHSINGSPVKVGAHEHMGVWLTEVHIAFIPQEPSQGFMHFSLMQA